MITATFSVSKLANNDKDNVQTLGNFYIGITNDHSWSIITPYLDHFIHRKSSVKTMNIQQFRPSFLLTVKYPQIISSPKQIWVTWKELKFPSYPWTQITRTNANIYRLWGWGLFEMAAMPFPCNGLLLCCVNIPVGCRSSVYLNHLAT